MANHADIVMATIAKALDVPLNVVSEFLFISDMGNSTDESCMSRLAAT
jgi:hypothetical protein